MGIANIIESLLRAEMAGKMLHKYFPISSSQEPLCTSARLVSPQQTPKEVKQFGHTHVNIRVYICFQNKSVTVLSLYNFLPLVYWKVKYQ